ncbi:MAG: MBL fold metallo-hydrolase [Desulfovibrio sp.]|jgi:L-ascorbate metabolism protein UlaG (beta-lactamase superfamily)|nr:MBL fold metallo-hydrolase [Desulfovibrio sp.]
MQEELIGSQAWTFAENNNNAVRLQREGGDFSEPGQTCVEYFAHSCFRIRSPRGLTIVIDPWRNDPSGAWGSWFPKPFPEISCDVVLSTHAHFDHDAVHRVHAAVTLERPVGVFTLGDVRITGLGDKHMSAAKGSYVWTEVFAEGGVGLPPDNPMHLDNSIITVETGGLKFAHWGDNRPTPAGHVMEALRGTDVLILPIESSDHILTCADVDALIAAIKPRVVVPCHYRLKGAVSVLSTLQTADAFVNSHAPNERLASATWTLSPDDLPADGTCIVHFGDHFQTK